MAKTAVKFVEYSTVFGVFHEDNPLFNGAKHHPRSISPSTVSHQFIGNCNGNLKEAGFYDIYCLSRRVVRKDR